MGQLEDSIDLDRLLELRSHEIANFCESLLDAETLVEELENDGPFATSRKDFCQFLGIGESTLTGWLKGDRIPRSAKVAYVLLVGKQMLSAEIRRLRLEAEDLKIVQDGETFQVVRFEADETGVWTGRIIARDIPNARAARILAGSVKAFRMLQESLGLIDNAIELTQDAPWVANNLEKLRTRILKEIFATFEPEKWRELFGPTDFNLNPGDIEKWLSEDQESPPAAKPDSAPDDEGSDSQDAAGTPPNQDQGAE